MANPEDEIREQEEEHEEEDDDSSVVSHDSSESGSTTSSKKKRKKKKKKSKSSAGEGNGNASSSESSGMEQTGSTASSKADKQECERRFTSAMESVRASSDMWVKLDNCNIFDAKTKKLAEALGRNTSVTSVDLSANHISDEGAVHIASMLASNGAPELIQLDLRGNPLTPSGLESLEALKKQRKVLEVLLGPLTPPKAAASSAAVPEGEGMPKELKDLSKGPMFRKYFQGGSEEEEAGEADVASDGGVSPEQLWQQVSEDISQAPGSIPQLGVRLQQLVTLLNKELGTLQVPHVETVTDGSRPHIKGCAMHLDVLGQVLDIVPSPVTTQFSSEPQAAVGTHRVWASEVVALLLGPNVQALDNLVASSALVPRILHAALHHPMSSALHCRALRVLRSCCVSKVAALYRPLFTEGLGAGLKLGAEEQELCPALQQQLTNIVLPAMEVPVGRRRGVVGFALEACKVLQACCNEANRDSRIYNAGVARILQADAKWAEFAGGALQTVSKEQEGDLCGPRAARMQLENNSDMADMAGGGYFSGHEILTLLQNMHMSNGLAAIGS